MTTPTNPEKLWAFTRDRKRGVVGEPDISAHDTREHAEMCHGSPLFNESPVQAYVREDVAEAAVKAAEKETARLCSSAMYDVEDERDALRRERDAATEHAAAFAEVSRIVGIAYEADGRPVVPGPTDVVLAEVSEVLVAANQSRELKSERDAVRRERDALRLVARRAGDVLAWVANQLPKAARYEDGYECIAALNEAIDAVSAGKGVG